MALRNQEIGARLRELRGQRPQTVVADKLGVAERTYQNWEAGDAKPSYRNLQKIAEFYGVGENYVLTGERRSRATPALTSTPKRRSDQDDAMIEGDLAGILQAIKTQLAAQTAALREIKDVLGEIRGLLKTEGESATKLQAVTQRAGVAVDKLEQTTARAGRELRSGTPGQRSTASKPAAKRNPAA